VTPPIFPLKNRIQHYAWGSHTALAALRGDAAKSAEPEAELWMGAHPSAPSSADIPGGVPLPELIERDPQALLGPAEATFGRRLPFLLKVLAARTPLSLQAHPSPEQARVGFEREEKLGPPLTAKNRNYKDPYPKPELLCALGPFTALVGFREISATRRLLGALSAPSLAPLLELLATEPRARALSNFVEFVLAGPEAERKRIADEVAARCEALATSDAEFAREYAWGARIAALYPGDAGVALALALNLLELSPGQAIYLPAGNLHAYLEGTGVEIMASSDNVLRGGLTPKHVDVAELLRVLDFEAAPPELVRTARNGRELQYLTPAREFALSRIELATEALSVSTRPGPEIVLVTDGHAQVRHGTTSVELRAGASAFVTGDVHAYEVTGEGTLFRATVNVEA
jgi:mannose-6-phosphate isomerase